MEVTRSSPLRRPDAPVRCAHALALDPTRLDRMDGAVHTATFEALWAPAASARAPGAALEWVDAFHATLPFTADGSAEKAAFLRASPHQFFRGLPGLFYFDLRGAYAAASRLTAAPAPRTLLVGDAHLNNFGSVRSEDGGAMWTANDFDLAGHGPVEWDLERLAVSAWLAGAQLGMDAGARAALVREVGEAYLARLASTALPAGMRTRATAQQPVRDLLKDAESRSRKVFLRDWVEKDTLRFQRTSKLKAVDAQTRAAVEAALAAYEPTLPPSADARRPLRIYDVAARVAGGSTRGLPRFVALVERTRSDKAPLILELKVGLPPAYLDAQGAPVSTAPSTLVAHQRHLSPWVSPYVGTTELAGAEVLVRELEPQRDSVEISSVRGKKQLTRLAVAAAEVLAEVHLRASQAPETLRDWSQHASAQALPNLVAFAQSYGEQTLQDAAAYRASTAL